MVRQTEIRIAPDTTGRLATIAVTPGQHVHKGDLLAVLDNPELTAALGEAKAAAASAKAERDRVYSGVRAEEVAIAARAVQTAKANLLLAQQQYDRAAALAGKSFASKQTLDENTAALAKSKADLDLKQAQVAEAKAGPTSEERALADAQVTLAEATVAELQAQLDKTKLAAPTDGTIGIRVAEPGEIIGPGKPVMTMEADGQAWFAFTIREDDLHDITLGRTVAVTVQDGRQIEARVTELRPLGEFATWRAARAVGDHDLNSFRLRLDPNGDVDGLEPGMTVWLAAHP
ncbi:efflux RND transporter periplasmic adaptor subunit [Mesorhizobium sp. BAC0120]|uniref:HlyD family secretion protein n=1 Tax=Mesorhizobium sp. BAC0120 TaxID=3090670 RepID=UPI00298CC890|nr:HlyD family efflux transporter periplasmic adaptor subunit [Mesorhizobium sp. BAC0120]MDW6023400.1 efflux RND transporter periplasmic adaptor subunit [Mesorhizobium sp. BAC0120]